MKLPPSVQRLFYRYHAGRLDTDRDAALIIPTVMEEGSLDDWEWLFSTYGWESLAAWVAAHASQLSPPMERFWTLETEDSTAASFRTLFQTMLMATIIALVLSSTKLVQHMLCFPETLGLIMAAQLLIGRYTGYRLMELLRFREFLNQPPEQHPWALDSEL